MHRLLIVDDDDVDRETVRRALREVRDLNLGEAASAELALDAIAKDLPDIVVTDLRMSGMGGLELLRHLREDHPTILSILMTSQGSEQIAVEALHAGAIGYVPKRDVPVEMADAVRRALGMIDARNRHRKLMAYFSSRETSFEMDNDPRLASSLGTSVQEDLERIGFGDGAVRNHIAVAIIEAVTNAMVHGNLEVDSALRDDSHEAFEARIQQRRNESPYRDRRVRFTARETPREIEYTVSDEGPGFDPATLPDPRSPENLLKLSGRGVLLIRTFMDEVEFRDGGRTIVMRKRVD
jgi:DNA-binding NarL/FixJ family response regulator